MSKRVVLNFGRGSFETGFPSVTAELWETNGVRSQQLIGSLPSAPEIITCYREWKHLYNALAQRLRLSLSIEIESVSLTNVSQDDLHGLCQRLQVEINYWLNAETFRVYNRKRGLHLVVVYLVVGEWRVPWSFRVWRGKGTTSPAQLGLKLVKCLPQKLTKHFKVMILADTAFGSIEFLHGIRKLKYHAIVGVRIDRKLVDGRILRRLHKRGQQVWFVGLKFPVTVSWYYLKRDNGKLEKRFVLSTKPLKASTINWWGKRRWQIEGWFKTVKHRFGLHRFGQGTLLGVYRWLVLSLIAYILAHWAYLSIATTGLPDWGSAAQLAFQTFFPKLLLCCFLLDLERIRPIALSHGIDIQIYRCKI